MMTPSSNALEAAPVTDELSHAILASYPGYVALLDARGTVIAVNDGWRSFSALSYAGIGCDYESGEAADGVGRNYLEVCRRAAVQGNTSARDVLQGVSAVLEGRDECFRLEYDCATPAGHRWYEMYVRPLRRTTGGVLVAHMDTTERRRVELELQEARQELAHAAQFAAAGELIGAVVHDIRQPLTSIQMNVQAARHLLATDVSRLSEVRDALDDTLQEERRVAEILKVMNNLVARREPKWSRVEINDVARDVARIVLTEAIARRTRVELMLDSALTLVPGDASQIRQAALSLVLSALDAQSRRTEVPRSILIRTSVFQRGRVELSVSGVLKGESTGADGGGDVERSRWTLALARSVAEGHNGYLIADRQDSSGVVRMVLPVAQPAEAEHGEG